MSPNPSCWSAISRPRRVDDAVAAAEAAPAAGALADAELVHDDGVAALEDLDVADARVRDVRVHARRTVPPWTRARAACNGLRASALVGMCWEGERVSHLVVAPANDVLAVLVLPAGAEREVADRDMNMLVIL